MNLIASLQILTLFLFIYGRAQTVNEGWKYIGPGQTDEQVKGLIKSVWVDESNPAFILAGSCSGGLFKTENALDKIPVWQNISDTYNGINFGVSDIVVIPGTENKTIYMASGHNSGLLLGYGNGILKTSDGGKSWMEAGPKGKRRNLFMLEGLVANPQNPNEMIAYSAKELFLTRNAWLSFEKINLPIDSTNKNISFCDVEFAPFEPGKFYVCTRTYNFYDARLYSCGNYGKTITDITPKDIQSERFEVAVINNERFKGKFYAALGNDKVYIKYFNGNLFSTLNPLPVTQFYGGAYWNLEMQVNQADTSVIYVCMTEVSRSSDGGKTFEKIGTYNGHNIHADVRAIALPKSTKGGNSDFFVVANDGGVSLLNNENGVSWKSLNGEGLNANQFWGADVAQSDSLLIAGGVQDNGCFLLTGSTTFNTMGSCGDGYLGLVIDENSAITECNAPALFYHNLKTRRQAYLSVNDKWYDTKRPLVQTDSFIYIGYHDVWRARKSDMKKGNFSFLNVSAIPATLSDNGSQQNRAIKSMAIGNNRQVLVCYTNPNWNSKENRGKVFFCDDINKSQSVWKDITGLIDYNTMEVCRWFEICAVEFSNVNDYTFYFVAKDPFDQTNSLLYKCVYDADSSKCKLEQINSNLPAIGINRIRTDKFSNITYLACDDGVYFCNLQKDSIWQKMVGRDKLPSVQVSDIAFNYATNTILAATYGRGLWQSNLVSSYSFQKIIFENSVENHPVKVDGKLIVSKRKTYTINSKLIITKGSLIELKKGSTLVIWDKKLVRDEFNKPINLDAFLKKNKGAEIIYGRN